MSATTKIEIPRQHPIRFTPENVRAILQGRKTQTRRIVKLTDSGRIKKPGSPKNWHPDDANAVQACPYGMPGDRLWVRETWACDRCYDHLKPSAIPAGRPVYYHYSEPNHIVENWHKKRPSIFMPRWACRLVLELTEVRVERLNDCSEADAKAEGCYPGQYEFENAEGTLTARESFECLWGDINGEGSWAINPWVWVIEFKKVA